MDETLKLLKYLDIFQIVEKADGTHSVDGIATSDRVDKDNERADYGDTLKNLSAWSSEIEKTTSASGQEVSLGNIRVQHDSKQIGGKVTAIQPNKEKRHIFIATEPRKSVYDDIIKTGMVSGFSIAGSYEYRKCDECDTDIAGRGHFCNKCKKDVVVRYAPIFSEISYVDNPCNPDAQFTAVKADGAREIIKCAELRKAAETARQHEEKPDAVKSLRQELIEAGIIKEKKTKRVAGEDLTADCFAYVGDKDDTSTWKLPIKFSSDAKTKSHIRNALARFNQTQGIPAGEKAKVKAKIVAAAKKHGIEVTERSKKCVEHALLLVLRENSADYQGTTAKECAERCLATVSEVIEKVDGETKLFKGLYTVSQLAEILQGLQWIVASTEYERDYEGDESTVPDDLRGALEDLIPIFIAMATEEAKELLTQNKKTANGGQGGKSMSETNADLLKAAKERVIELWKKAKSLFHKMAKSHDGCAKTFHKAAEHHENLSEHCTGCAEAAADKAVTADLEKLANGDEFKKMANVDKLLAKAEVLEKAKGHAGHFGKMAKAHAHLSKCMTKAAGHHEDLDKAAVAIGDAEEAIDMQGTEHDDKEAHPGGSSEKTAQQKEAERVAKEAADKKAADDLAKAAAGNDALAKVISEGFASMKKANEDLKAEIEAVKADVKKQGDALENGPVANAKKNHLSNPSGNGRDAGNGNSGGSSGNMLKPSTPTSGKTAAAGIFGK